MKKGISFYFGVSNPPEERAKLISKAGFDSVITCNDKRFEKSDGSFKTQMALFKKYGISPSSLHMNYLTSELPEFWKNGKIGKKLEKNLKNDVKTAKKYGFSCVVVHLTGTPNQIGYDRLNRILKLCKRVEVPLAIENINDQDCFLKTFENVKSEYLRFCYDSGHHNLFDPEFDYLTEFKDKLVALHLHDNLGENASKKRMEELNNLSYQKDMHTLNKYGNINWEKIAKKLAKVKQSYVLDYEIMMHSNSGESAEEILSEVYKQACSLEDMIKKYKVSKKKK